MTNSEIMRDLLLQAYTKQEAFDWLFLPHPQFEGESAMELIRHGRFEEVLACIRRLDDCAYL